MGLYEEFRKLGYSEDEAQMLAELAGNNDGQTLGDDVGKYLKILADRFNGNFDN